MGFLVYLGALNILIVPFVIYIHAKGPCELTTSLVGPGASSICPYIKNPFLNIVYLNAVLVALGIVIWANAQVVPSHPKKNRFPRH